MAWKKEDYNKVKKEAMKVFDFASARGIEVSVTGKPHAEKLIVKGSPALFDEVRHNLEDYSRINSEDPVLVNDVQVRTFEVGKFIFTLEGEK